MLDWIDGWQLIEAVAGMLAIMLGVRYWQRMAKRRRGQAMQRDERLRTLGS